MNVGLRMASLGINTQIISRIGQDEIGKELLDFVSQNGVSTDSIQVDNTFATGEVLVKLDEKGSASYTINYPVAWDKIEAVHKDETENKVLQRLIKEIDLRGVLDVIRKGFTDYGVKFQMAFFQPESTLSPDAEALYQQNHLSVTRQLYYERVGRNSLDMVLSLNGIPMATIELKNQFSGQTVENAKKQYVYDREPSEPIFEFKKRTLVHFAVDTDEAYMTTKLSGKATRYLPFNLGYNNGAANPINPNGYRTAYLWEQVWAKDSFMDIIGKFMHLSVEEFEMNGVKKKKESIIFPRYHQLQVVRKVTADAKINGVGKNYLIQHSAGSGKSNSVA